MASKKKRSLLDEEEGDGGAADFGIRVNKDYAARFEHNKRREEMHRLQAKHPELAEKLARKAAREAALAAGRAPPPDSEDEDSSDDEEEDDGEIPSDTEAKIFDTLLRIRRQDPAIYQKDVKFFDDEEGDGEEGGPAGGGKSKKAKPVFLKDLIAKQALEYGAEPSSSDEEGGGGGKPGKKRHPKAYDAEQENLRKAFLNAAQDELEAAAGEEALGGVLRRRAEDAQAAGKEEDDSDGEQEKPQNKKSAKGKKAATKGGGAGGGMDQLLEAYFGTETELHPDDQFLKEFIVNKGWMDRDDDYVPSYREVVGDGEQGEGEAVDDEEDEAYLRQMDVFEAKYNFRFEEPGADRIITHPREVEGTVRKPDDKRKRQREAKKQRQAEVEETAREEVKRLKNLKKQEIEDKLGKLREVAGAAAPAAASLDEVLEGDFDPEEWDKKMAAAFGDEYYEAEEELDGLADELGEVGGVSDDDGALGADEDEEGDADEGAGGRGKPVRLATLEKKLKQLDELSEDPEDGKGGAGPAARARQRAELQRLLEEYYKLDYEDEVAGVRTRFRYKEVPASTFGLSVDDILRLDDKQLNQVVGIKRLAPYREDGDKLRPNYKALQAIKGELANVPHHRRQQVRGWKKGPGHGARDWTGERHGAGREKGERHGAGRDKGDRGHDDKPAKQDAGQEEGQAGPGPGSEAGAKADKKRPRSDGGHVGGAEGQPKGDRPDGQPKGDRKRKQLDPQQARLASYAVPTLKKDAGASRGGDGPSKKKRKGGEQGQQDGGKAAAAEPSGPQLSRAAKKNLKRSQKRAGKRQTTGTAA